MNNIRINQLENNIFSKFHDDYFEVIIKDLGNWRSWWMQKCNLDLDNAESIKTQLEIWLTFYYGTLYKQEEYSFSTIAKHFEKLFSNFQRLEILPIFPSYIKLNEKEFADFLLDYNPSADGFVYMKYNEFIGFIVFYNTK